MFWMHKWSSGVCELSKHVKLLYGLYWSGSWWKKLITVQLVLQSYELKKSGSFSKCAFL